MKLTEKNKTHIKKVIAREFLYLLGGIILYIILEISYLDDTIVPESEIVIPLVILFVIRYFIYATKWSIKQLKN